MPTSPRLYLDTARLGLMTPSAQSAIWDFTRFSGEVGSILYGEKLLVDGFSGWPESFRNRYVGLRQWPGLGQFDNLVEKCLGLRSSASCVVASQTRELARIAIRALAANCSTVLTTDLTWPEYAGLMEQAENTAPNKFQLVRVRSFVREKLPSVASIIEVIADQYEELDCDGVFLTAVSHDGCRLPIDRLIRELNQRRPLRLAVVDGCQALGHVPDDIGLDSCDIFLASGHKWLGCGVPVGLGILPRASTRKDLLEQLRSDLNGGICDDPLMSLTQRYMSGRSDSFSGTVNLSPLYALSAALCSPLGWNGAAANSFDVRKENCRAVMECLKSSCFETIRMPCELPTGIVLLQLMDQESQRISAKGLANAFAAMGIDLTAYEGGLVRLSMPDIPLVAQDLNRIKLAARRLKVDGVRCKTNDSIKCGGLATK